MSGRKVTRLISQQEAAGLRELALTAYGSIETFLPKQSRIRLGHLDGTPFKMVVRIGHNPGFEQAEYERFKLGLWSREWFRYRPKCRLCAGPIDDRVKALCFAFNPDGHFDAPYWRKAYIHAEEEICDLFQ